MNFDNVIVVSIVSAMVVFVAGVVVGMNSTGYKKELERKDERIRELEEEHLKDVERREDAANEKLNAYSPSDDLRKKCQEAAKNPEESIAPPDDDPDKPEEPYEIDEVEFAMAFQDCESMSFNYYVEDAVLTDELDNRIDDPEDVIGKEALDKLYAMTQDDFQQVIHFRNPVSDLVYEIIVENEISYYRDVLGIDDDDDEDEL